MKKTQASESQGNETKSHKKFPFELIIVLMVLATQLYVAFMPVDNLLNWFSIDDAFYYFKVAQNFASGRGVTFDGINPTNGFHPLWMIVCISIFAIANLSRIMALRILVIVLVLFNAITSVLLYRLLSMFISKKTAFIGSIFWALFPAIQTITTQQGLEAGLSAFFIMMFLFMAAKYQEPKQPVQKWLKLGCLGLIGACVILSRLDNIFIVGTIGLWVLLGRTEIRKQLVVDIFAAFFCIVSACLIWLGLEGDYNRYAIPIFIAVILKLLIFHIFKFDKSPKKILSIAFFIRLVTLVTISSGLLAVINYVIARISRQVSFSKGVLFFDAVFSLIIFGGIQVFRRRRNSLTIRNTNEPLKYDWKKIAQNVGIALLPIVILVGGYIAWNYFTFGILTPISGQVKHWWSTLPNTVYAHKVNAITYLGLSSNPSYGPWSLLTSPPNRLAFLVIKQINVDANFYFPYVFLLFFCLEVVLILLVIKKEEQQNFVIANHIGLLALFSGCLLQFSYYMVTSYTHTRSWYWVAQMICVVIFLSIVLENGFHYLQRKAGKDWIQVGISILISVMILFNFTSFMTELFPLSGKPNSETILDEVQHLEQSTDSGSIIGMTGGGNIAYFINDRTIINLDGLINSPKYFRALKTGKANDFINEMQIEYIYGSEYMLTKSDPYKDIFAGHLEKIQNRYISDSFSLYRYNPYK